MAPGVSRRGPHGLPEREPAIRISDRTSFRRRDSRKATWRHRKLCLYCVGLSVALAWLFVLVFFLFQQSVISIDKRGTRSSNGAEMSFGKGGWGTERREQWFLPFSSMSIETKFHEGKLEKFEIERSQRSKTGLRLPSLALILAKTDKDAQLIMLLTLAKGLTELGYNLTIFTLEERETDYLCKDIGFRVQILSSDESTSVDWSNYEGVILGSLEAKQVLSSLVQEPFLNTPLIWLINEDNLGKRLNEYKDKGFDDLITHWKNAFHRADIIIFNDFSLPLLYAPLDLKNFIVIPGSPASILESEKYISSHSRDFTRNNYGFKEGDFVILFLRSYFVYDEIPWDYIAIIEALAPRVLKLQKNMGDKIHVIFLHGNSSDIENSSFQELAKKMGFSDDSMHYYHLNHDINSLIFLSDIVLYASLQEELYFPHILLRAMSFGVPIIAPNITQIMKHVTNGVNGFIFNPNDSSTLTKSFSVAIDKNKISNLAKNIANQGKFLSKNMLAFDFISSHAIILENILNFPSDVMLPYNINHIKQKTWLWEIVNEEREKVTGQSIETSTVDKLEGQFVKNVSARGEYFENEGLNGDFENELDWDELSQIEIFEDIERIEVQELEERIEKPLSTWEIVYHTSRKLEKSTTLKKELDEGVLERIGQQVCIYEIYNGEGSWPFLHHGSLYRAISLSRSGRRLGTDDVDAVSRLPVLENKYYRDLLCEFGAMLSVANRVDSIHTLPFIGFQSWRASSRKVSLSKNAEEKLEMIMNEGNNGDALYFWVSNNNLNLDFWSMCDHLNAGHCRSLFGDAFRHMYGLTDEMMTLPPMPAGGHWSTLHSWVMPTPSFLEFMIFSRMFLASLDQMSYNATNPSACLLGSSTLEKRQCYCRVLELLINIWAYHSGRKIFYLNPKTGDIYEQHPLSSRGAIWSKYFELPLLKAMDEDFAEEADDCLSENGGSLFWGLTGEVQWQGVYEREREERYVKKMDKKRKSKEKLMDRYKFGYKQKAIE